MNKESFKHYMLGIPEIDDEHWYLISLMEKLNKPGIDQNKLAADFRTAFIKHCEHEESYMESIGYPYIESHKEQHIFLGDKIRNAIKRIAAGYGDEFIGNSLIRELTTHIDHYDLQMVEFLKNGKN